MEIRMLSVIYEKEGRAVVSGSSCELAEFLNHAGRSPFILQLASEKGISPEVVEAIFSESARLIKLVRPVHIKIGEPESPKH